jgi:hypothetical protein
MGRVAPLAFLLLLLDLTCVRAQSINATLSGRVTDTAKAMIVDARIVAISDATGARYETSTGGSGEYHLANLPPGSYHLEIERSGFKKLFKRDLILHVQDALKIDFEMTVGEVTERVTVEPGAPLVNTESATVSTVIDRRFVDNLPLNGRTFQTLIALTPGVVLTPTALFDQGNSA